MATSSSRPTAEPSSDLHHVVQFYEDDHTLCHSVATYFADALRNQSPVIAIATPAHRRGIERSLREQGVDVRAAGKTAQLTWRDASEILKLFMVNGMPDASLVEQHLGAALETVRPDPGGPPLRAFGETVNVLWRGGNHAAAIRLEELCNDLAARYPFSLLCAYDFGNFSHSSDATSLIEVCAHHTHAIPAESYRANWTEPERQRAILKLQQRARALETEIQQRRVLEQSLRRVLASRRSAERERTVLARTARLKSHQAALHQDQVVAQICHDLKTPLNAIRGWTQVLAGTRPDEAMLQHALEVIDRNTRQLDQLIDGLVDSKQPPATAAP